MNLGLVGQAAGMFAVTNIDDLVILAVFFGQARLRGSALRVVLGQYLGFGAIVLAAVVGASGAGLLPESVLPYLGLMPLLLGLRAAWNVRRSAITDADDEPRPTAIGAGQVAAVTFANGGDNIGVYVPVFATVGVTRMIAYVAVFLVGVAVWCAMARFLASRPPVAKTLSRWGHVILPAVLIGIGLLILIQGHAFGL